MTLWNWNDSARCDPAEVVAPSTVDELAAIVADTALYPSPLRAIGELHSLNECFTTTGTAVLMRHFTRRDEPVGGTVTVGAGVRMIDLRDWLRPHGLQIEVVPEIGKATAGSVACCGTKDSSLGPDGLGQISSTVVGVRMVRPNGDLSGSGWRCSPPLDRRVLGRAGGFLGFLLPYHQRLLVERRTVVPGSSTTSPPATARGRS